MKKTGILVVNLGTPDSPATRDVKKYLTEFLMDPRVIDLPAVQRALLVKGVIVPFRAPKVAREYRKLWMDEGAPLRVYGRRLVKTLQARFAGQPVVVALGMRYQNPSLAAALQALRAQNVDRILVFPLFPQYASATTGSVAEEVMRHMADWHVIPSVEFINAYHDDPRYIRAFADKVAHDLQRYQPDHVLFSYHGIPERHLQRLQEENAAQCAWPACDCGPHSAHRRYCYRSACFRTSELIARQVGLSVAHYTTAFQSRLGKDPWIQPYTDQTIRALRRRGVNHLLVVAPSFVADCLETVLEIGEEYNDLFLEEGGTTFHYTESLNDSEAWVDAIYHMLNEKLENHEIPDAFFGAAHGDTGVGATPLRRF
ncbi:ferrochelatase [Catalinimonas alkaloidigena]|uniref:Ferrochelatase n=1 Tax=Catalinimonas alkaloidigena TaxID=1075417 RepID=A0A1G8YCN8_9BACT|nr:ferrochelatase [Catalinimonas alkaloidigena]SDK00481.1 ferrochelatase [Catalinimonas alkaloidigena]